MRSLAYCSCFLGLFALACSGSKDGSGFGDDGGASGSSGTSGGSSGTSGGSSGTFGGDGGNPALSDGSVTTSTTIYAHTDDTLYTMDPATLAVVKVGAFTGNAGAITDLAVNAAGDVYVNSETVIYRATIPSTPGPVGVTPIATIAAKNGQKFYALAFATAGVLGAGEGLVGGDGTGELWSIDPASGATVHLGSFGNDPKVSGNVLGLSGDIVFYSDASGKPTGLATVRSCKAGGTSCSKTNDYLVGIDMAALASAFTSGTPAATLLAGIYGGSVGNPGPGREKALQRPEVEPGGGRKLTDKILHAKSRRSPHAVQFDPLQRHTSTLSDDARVRVVTRRQPTPRRPRPPLGRALGPWAARRSDCFANGCEACWSAASTWLDAAPSCAEGRTCCIYACPD